MFKGLFRSKTNMGEMLYQGKVKQVWSTDDPDILEFRFTNQISVFDQIIPSLIPFLFGSIGPGIVFGFFAFMMVLQLMFTHFIMPETKGVSLEDLSKKLIKN